MGGGLFRCSRHAERRAGRLYGGAVAVPDGGTAKYEFSHNNQMIPHSDSPISVLTGPNATGGFGTEFYQASIDESFNDYLMYRPTGGVWVTLATMSWFWSGKGKYDAPTGIYLPASVFQASPAALTGVKSASLPQWSGLANDLIVQKPQ